MWLLALLHWNLSLILTDYNEGGGHGVCETLCLDTCFDAIECFSNEAILINYTGMVGGPGVCKILRLVTGVCCNESVLD